MDHLINDHHHLIRNHLLICFPRCTRRFDASSRLFTSQLICLQENIVLNLKFWSVISLPQLATCKSFPDIDISKQPHQQRRLLGKTLWRDFEGDSWGDSGRGLFLAKISSGDSWQMEKILGIYLKKIADGLDLFPRKLESHFLLHFA